MFTFDDGFETVYLDAFPRLLAHRKKFWIFLTTDFISGMRIWSDDLMMLSQDPSFLSLAGEWAGSNDPFNFENYSSYASMRIYLKNTDNRSSRIFRNLNDEFLEKHWNRLGSQYQYFPQSLYDWCKAWWRHLRGRRKLYIVVGVVPDGEVVGIAPMCIEREFGISVLRSIPIQFGDYYRVIVVKDNRGDDFVKTLVQHLRTFAEWGVVRFDQINSRDVRLFPYLTRQPDIREKLLTNCILANFEGSSWEEYFKRLRKKHRDDVKRRMKKLESEKRVELRRVESAEEFAEYLPTLRAIHAERWKDDYAPQKSARKLACEEEAFKRCFRRDAAVLWVLLADGEIASYTIGFRHRCSTIGALATIRRLGNTALGYL